MPSCVRERLKKKKKKVMVVVQLCQAHGLAVEPFGPHMCKHVLLQLLWLLVVS